MTEILYYSYDDQLYGVTMPATLSGARNKAERLFDLNSTPLLKCITSNGNAFVVVDDEVWYFVKKQRDREKDFIVQVVLSNEGTNKRKREEEEVEQPMERRDGGKEQRRGNATEGEDEDENEDNSVGVKERNAVAGPSGVVKVPQKGMATLEQRPVPPRVPPVAPLERIIKPKPEPISPILPPAALSDDAMPILPPSDRTRPRNVAPPLPPPTRFNQKVVPPMQCVSTPSADQRSPTKLLALGFHITFPRSNRPFVFEVNARADEQFVNIYGALERHIRTDQTTKSEHQPIKRANFLSNAASRIVSTNSIHR